MQKVTIPFKNNKTLFTTSIPVLVSHLNYGNHLGYDSILTLLQEARMRWLKESNMGEMTLDGNIGYLVTDVALKYKSEAFHGDILDIEFYLEDFNNRTFTILYKISNQTTGAIVALASTGHVFYDFSLKKIARAPECIAMFNRSRDRVAG